MSEGALVVRYDDEERVALDVARWLGPVTAADETVLQRAVGPVLDIGCGPGRHVHALARRGVLALGVDVSPDAVRLARSRGAPVVEGSVFDVVPGPHRWGSALLLDGSVGIGGAPRRLLGRVRELLVPGGRLLVETEAPGVATRTVRARLEGTGARSAAFPWALVGADGIGALGAATGFATVERWCDDGRWFAELR
ncbi:methyltransferase domain-containing protein [Baekduia soli]|uniref:Methyltransferase domain-containing protein n=1 Tax=Baekduia soli TaxID=496014 RepID=A0A5B8UD58_9ACTN|nr:methyltransferase domain-containing protein [Baekduia soli]